MRNVLDLWGQFQNYITAGLAAIVVVTSLGWYVTDLRLDTANEKVKVCNNGRELDRSKYEAAQRQYEADALREKQAIEQRNRERAEEADANYGALRSKYDAAIMRRYNAPRSPVSGNDLPGTPATAPSGDRPGPGSIVPEITITVEDAEICAENTARLQIVHDWEKGN